MTRSESACLTSRWKRWGVGFNVEPAKTPWLLKGDVRSRVVTALLEEGWTDMSEADLARFAQCTRKAMHTALANLEWAGRITRGRGGRRYLISAA